MPPRSGLHKRYRAAVALASTLHLHVASCHTESSWQIFLIYSLSTRIRALLLLLVLCMFCCEFSFVRPVHIWCSLGIALFWFWLCVGYLFSFFFLSSHRDDFAPPACWLFRTLTSFVYRFPATVEPKLRSILWRSVVSGCRWLFTCCINAFRC